MQNVRHLRHGEHHHLERDDHRKHQQIIQERTDAGFHAGDAPSRHGGEQHDRPHGKNGDEKGIPEGRDKSGLFNTGNVILYPHKGPSVGEGKRRVGYEKSALEGIHQDQEDRGQVDDGQDQQKDESGVFPKGSLGLHQRSTSLRLEKYSCSSTMAATMAKKTTAFAWPTPSYPVRP